MVVRSVRKLLWLLVPGVVAAQTALTSGVPVPIYSSQTNGICVPGTQVCCVDAYGSFVIDVPDSAVALDMRIQIRSGSVSITTRYAQMPDITSCPQAGSFVSGDFYVDQAVHPDNSDYTYTLARDGRTVLLRTGKYYFVLQHGILHSTIDATFTVTVRTKGPAIGSNSAIVDAAQYLGLVVPGGLMSIFGMGIGPAQGVTAQLAGDGNSIGTTLGGVTVYVDGVRAPLIYASSAQVNAVAPFGLNVTKNYASTDTVKVELDYQGVRANTVYQFASTARAEMFLMDSATRQGAVVNETGQVNSGAYPAKAGSVISLYATGLGPASPQVADGAIPAGATFQAAYPVQVYLTPCRVPAEAGTSSWCPGVGDTSSVSRWPWQCPVLYAGAAP